MVPLRALVRTAVGGRARRGAVDSWGAFAAAFVTSSPAHARAPPATRQPARRGARTTPLYAPLPRLSRAQAIAMRAAERCENAEAVTFLDQATATRVDERLMSEEVGFTLEQLMELAGVAVAHAVADVIERSLGGGRADTAAHVVVVAGPGNNGGDGLVAARHLCLMGHRVTVLYPKVGRHEHYKRLLRQLHAHTAAAAAASMLTVSTDASSVPADADVLVDAVFGFSFSPDGGVRAPFDALLREMDAHRAPVVCVDVPSGWRVDGGADNDDDGGKPPPPRISKPAAVVSLTAPKLAMRDFTGVHYVGGRFVPPSIAKEFDLTLPNYPGCTAVVRLT